MKKNNFSSQKGQVVLIIVLVMVVLGTIALSVASRSVTDIGLSRQEEEKIRAFSVAEAGLEDLLTQGLAGKVGVGTGKLGTGIERISYDYKIEEFGSGSSYELAEPLANGEATEIVLGKGVDNPHELEFCWIDEGSSTQMSDDKRASLEITFFNQDGSNYSLRRYAFNPPAEGSFSPPDNGFDKGKKVVSGHCEGGTRPYYAYERINFITFYNQVKFMRIKAFYNQASLGILVVGNAQLPPQAYKVKVTAKEGESSAALELEQSKQTHVPIFDYVLWSGAGVTK